MARKAVGRRDGRANALTLVLPLRMWGVPWLLGLFWDLRRPQRRDKFSATDRLRFIYAIRWSLLPPFEPRVRGQRRTREQRWHLLFESNFDGDWDEYLNAFGTVLGPDLHNLIVPALGYPGMDDLSLFKAWAKVNDRVPEHYASAYPDLTAIGIRQLLHHAEGSSAREAIVAEGYGRTAPTWTTFLLPIVAGRASVAATAARALDRPAPPGQPTSALLDGPGDVHFARVTILDQPTRPWLLFTLVHTGSAEAIVRALLAAESAQPGAPGVGPFHDLLATVDGVPGPETGWTDADSVALLLAHRRAPRWQTLGYCAYPGWSVAELIEHRDRAVGSDAWPVAEGES